MKGIIKIAVLFMIAFSTLSAYQMPEKMYIDDDQIASHNQGNAFNIHVGNNNWLVTNTIHRDSTGLFTYESSLRKSRLSMEYEKNWKCPYCYIHYPIGKPCSNQNCPSKYK